MKSLAYDGFLQDLISRMESRDYSVEPECERERLNLFKEICRRGLLLEIPPELEIFWRKINGFKYRGTVVLGVDDPDFENPENDFTHDGLLSANKQRDISEKQILLGWSNLDLFVYSPQERRYVILEKETHSEMSAFDSFEELLTAVLEELLDEEDE